jgi:broad specificity phosphatase PhoE
MTTLLVARHGETDWNREGRWQGWADPALNETGRAQARHLAGELRDTAFDAVYSSDLRRAFETAEILAAPHKVPVVADPGLREIDVGS